MPQPRLADDDPPEPAPSEIAVTTADLDVEPASEISKESEPQTEEARREAVIKQLSQIHAALEEYRGRRGYYPFASRGELSWRTTLLLELGDKELYSAFRLKESWDSPYNRKLTSRIPAAFRSQSGNRQKTPMVLVTGDETLYRSDLTTGPSDKDCPDGLDNTLLLIEIEPSFAVAWSAAEDYVFDRSTVHQAFFGHRKDCCYALFGGKTGVRKIPADISDEDLLALITPDYGEDVHVLDITRPATPEVDEALIARLDEEPIQRFAEAAVGAAEVASVEVASVESNAEDPISDESAADAKPSTTAIDEPIVILPVDSRLPVPEPDRLQQASLLFKDIYGDEYDEASRPEQKRAFASKMINEASRLNSDPSGAFVLYRAARDVAAEAGDFDTAFQAIDQLTSGFQMDPFPMKLAVLQRTAKAPYEKSELLTLQRNALKLVSEAFDRDAFDEAELLCDLAMGTSRRIEDYSAMADIDQKRNQLKLRRTAYAKISAELHVLLRDPTNPESNAIVGEYLCLTKGMWERGVVMLQRGDDEDLQELARRENSTENDPNSLVAIGDGWWEWAEASRNELQETNARARAVHWYQLAVAGLPASLIKNRVQQRIDQIAAATASQKAESVSRSF